ncbi:hypothetical protein Bpfe_007116, partial [Biomphalaria pfeifferi]
MNMNTAKNNFLILVFAAFMEGLLNANYDSCYEVNPYHGSSIDMMCGLRNLKTSSCDIKIELQSAITKELPTYLTLAVYHISTGQSKTTENLPLGKPWTLKFAYQISENDQDAPMSYRIVLIMKNASCVESGRYKCVIDYNCQETQNLSLSLFMTVGDMCQRDMATLSPQGFFNKTVTVTFQVPIIFGEINVSMKSLQNDTWRFFCSYKGTTPFYTRWHSSIETSSRENSTLVTSGISVQKSQKVSELGWCSVIEYKSTLTINLPNEKRRITYHCISFSTDKKPVLSNFITLEPSF